jgi:hypothetical protein
MTWWEILMVYIDVRKFITPREARAWPRGWWEQDRACENHGQIPIPRLEKGVDQPQQEQEELTPIMGWSRVSGLDLLPKKKGSRGHATNLCSHSEKAFLLSTRPTCPGSNLLPAR